MSVVIIDYGSGNLRSAAKAFERAAGTLSPAPAIAVTDRPEAVAAADRLVLPGVGAFADCLAGIGRIAGLRDALEDAVIARGVPFFGICVGMQLMADRGLEHGEHPGFGWVGGEVVALEPSDPSLKIPHMGWNALDLKTPDHPVFARLARGLDHAYFVHSYSFHAADPAHVLATVDYGGRVAAMVGRDNLVGTQFHPEKSQRLGLSLIEGFLHWRP